jgi:hypothetical protein
MCCRGITLKAHASNAGAASESYELETPDMTTRTSYVHGRYNNDNNIDLRQRQALCAHTVPTS